MKHYGRAEILDFLGRLDAKLEEPVGLVVVGGAAAVIAYGAESPTKDIDTWTNVPPAVQEAADELVAAGKGVPLGKSGVAELPYDSEDRFRAAELGLEKLEIVLPDPYDLALSKIARGYEHDYQVIEEMHDEEPFSLERFVELFEAEFDGLATTNKRKLRLSMAILVARLFGDEAGQEVAARWGVVAPTVPPHRKKS